MLARGRVNDDCLISTRTVDFFHAEAVALQPTFGLRGTQIHIQPVAFEFLHRIQFLRRLYCRTKRPSRQFDDFASVSILLGFEV